MVEVLAVPVHGAWRLVRAATLAGTVVALAATAHLAGGGRLPGPVLLLALLVLTGCGSLLLTGRRLGAPVLLAALGGGQLLLHGAFEQFAVRTVSVASVGHHQEWVPLGAGAIAHTSTASTASSAALMTAAHVAATVLSALALAHGERVLWQAWTWLQPLRAVVVLVLRTPVLRPLPAPPARVLPRPASVVARRVRRRGPPRVPALATTR